MKPVIASAAAGGVLARHDLGRLFESLRDQGYEVVGPTLRDGAIVYDRLESVDALPAGWTDEQQPGRYRVQRRGDAALFGYAVGPQSWKKFLHPPQARLWRSRRDGTGFEVVPGAEPPAKLAFLGARACELHALAIQDRVLLGGAFKDPVYQERRENLFVVAVNCSQAGGCCFCVSMATGPRVKSGFDLALTELLTGERHEFLVEVGTERGAAVMSGVGCRPASEADLESAERVVLRAAGQVARALDTEGLKELLYRNYEHPRWDDVASRCLTCGNCTLACPTCFCTTVEDTTDLTGDHAERRRQWDSCFTLDFSYIHGGSVRASAKARYRQWLTHKLAAWHDQFGSSGCVGCGRCLTWCPVGIDLTEEARAIRLSDGARVPKETDYANA